MQYEITYSRTFKIIADSIEEAETLAELELVVGLAKSMKEEDQFFDIKTVKIK